jgi:hypothetical protein
VYSRTNLCEQHRSQARGRQGGTLLLQNEGDRDIRRRRTSLRSQMYPQCSSGPRSEAGTCPSLRSSSILSNPEFVTALAHANMRAGPMTHHLYSFQKTRTLHPAAAGRWLRWNTFARACIAGETSPQTFSPPFSLSTDVCRGASVLETRVSIKLK